MRQICEFPLLLDVGGGGESDGVLSSPSGKGKSTLRPLRNQTFEERFKEEAGNTLTWNDFEAMDVQAQEKLRKIIESSNASMGSLIADRPMLPALSLSPRGEAGVVRDESSNVDGSPSALPPQGSQSARSVGTLRRPYPPQQSRPTRAQQRDNSQKEHRRSKKNRRGNKKKVLSLEEARTAWEKENRNSIMDPLLFELEAEKEQVLVKIIVHSLDGAVSVCCFWPSHGLSDALPIRPARVEPIFGISTDELLASIELKAVTANVKQGAAQTIKSIRRTNPTFETINTERMRQMHIPSVRVGLRVKGTYSVVKIEKLPGELRVAVSAFLPVEGLRARTLLKPGKVEKYFGMVS